ncbi:MAG: hypothetical protein IJX30_06860 [Clostridia bacterium]|nr:hypothetical protein [Clostridia bacterium]MBQ8447209.1 hypothetical protein [Clostridia bacterium]
MKRRFATIYAIFNTVCLLGGCILVFWLAWKAGTEQTIKALCGLAIGFVFAPVFHELGHVAFASATGMEYVYFKAFCFRFVRKDGKIKFSFASPFAADETQVIPKRGGNMQKRAAKYALGGLIVEGMALLVLLTTAILTTVLVKTSFELWGMVPYFAYLFLLNVLPLEYASGKTDMLVYRGVKKGADAEKNMLAAMEIQGQLYEGKSFAEIPETYYFDAPQLCEDEPLFAVMLDLKYRYYLEKEDFDHAADCLNRLAMAQVYLPDSEVVKIGAELTYMHSLNKDLERAEETSKVCREFLAEDNGTAKRVLAAYSYAVGKKDAVSTLKAQAEVYLAKERVKGVAKFESILLSRIEEE